MTPDLQQKLNSLQDWGSRWQIKFHPKECQVIRICTNKHFQHATNTLHGHILEAVDSTKYLGVTNSEELQWKTNIESITAKASRTTGFLRRNLYNCTKDVRVGTYMYQFLVRHILDYGTHTEALTSTD